MSENRNIDVAAALCGCKPGELLSYRVRENGDISVIAPTGQKFVYAKVLVDGQRESMAAASKPKPKPEPKPRRAAPAARKRAPAKPAASKAKAAPAKKPSAASSNDETKH